VFIVKFPVIVVAVYAATSLVKKMNIFLDNYPVHEAEGIMFSGCPSVRRYVLRAYVRAAAFLIGYNC